MPRRPWNPVKATPACSRELASRAAARTLKPGSSTASTSYRRNQAPDGIHEESISSYRRERVTLPMTLLPALVNEQTQALHWPVILE